MSPTDLLLTTRQAADILGLSPVTVRRMIENGTLISMKIGRDHMLHPADVEAAKSRPGPGRPPQGRQR